MPGPSDYRTLLRELSTEGVEFIIVGALAAVLQGAPIVTLDLDILRRRTPENVAKLLRALVRLDAVARGDPRRIAPNESHLRGPGHLLLDTRAGDLDVLGSIEDDTDFDAVIGDTIEMDLEGIRVRVLELSRVIRAKETAGRPKDLAVLPVLRATLEQIRSRARK
jgi:predicted nucleotidyltransferase